MSYYSNTTQTPNVLFNHLLKNLKDTELRVLLVIIHRTVGQIHPSIAGKRIERAWISQKLFVICTGKSARAVSTAIDTLVRNHYIEVTNGNGILLDTKEKRRGASRLYYASRLRLETTSKKPSEPTCHIPVTKVHTIKLNIIKESCYNSSQGVKKLSDTQRYQQIQNSLHVSDTNDTT